MRLLSLKDDGSLCLKWFSEDTVLPPYAILSHTWGTGEADEVTLKDLDPATTKNQSGFRKLQFWKGSGRGIANNKPGFKKLQFCAKQAKHDDLHYFWADTCCINKQDLAELTTAINSMFRWYQNAARCYVYLSDVSLQTQDAQFIHRDWESAFRNSRWFRRGWTLQELLAPKIVDFYSRDGVRLGDKISLKQQIAEITGIPIEAIQGLALSKFSIEERLSWVEKRQTTKAEDRSYCLLGLFQVFLPLIYGEGQSSAMRRLHRVIQESTSTEPQPTAIGTSGHSIPFSRNRRFVGRHAILEELEQKLLTDKICQSIAIVGLGGIGKTQVALEFAYKLKTDKPEYSIFWIPALSMESMEQACNDIARIRGISQATDDKQDIKELVRRYLSSEVAGQWLLIVDNADDMDLVFGTEHSDGIVDYLPKSESGLILFTTRYQAVAVSLADSNVIELKEMDTQEAVSFLEQALIRKQLLNNNTTNLKLLEELAYLPLAIAQAAAFLNNNKNTTILDYLRLLQNTEQGLVSLLSQEFRDNTRYKISANAVARTWLVSFNQIRNHDTVAADLLSFISCIESKAIPLSILPSVLPEDRMVSAIGTLCGYSFIVKRDEEDMYDMHRLVHLATRIWVKEHGTAAVAAEKAIQHVSNIFPNAKYANQKTMRRFLVHAVQLLGEQSRGNMEERYTLCQMVGQCLEYEGRIQEAVLRFEESYQWRKINLVEEHPDRLASQHELAMAYREDGQIKKAIELIEHVVAVKARTLAEEHPDRLASQHELAMAYRKDGQIKKAIELIEHVVAVEARTLAEEHPDRLASQHELAMAYREDGQIKKAIELIEHVVAVEARTLAEEHPDRLASQHELAMAYRKDGQIKKAIELIEHVVAVKARTLAEEHPDRLASQHELAMAYREDGQIKKAIELIEHVVAVKARTLAEEHPDRLASQHELAMAYREDGQIKKAIELIEHVVAVKARTLAEEHPDRLASQHELAMAYRKDGQIKKAIELIEHVVAVTARTLAEEHPDRLASEGMLKYLHADLLANSDLSATHGNEI